MTLVLRPYQTDLIDQTRIMLRETKSVLVQLPTGGGKTAISTQMLASVASKGKRGAFIVHRQELCDQTVKTFQKFSVPHGLIAAGYTPYLMAPIQICSIDTLRSRLLSGRVIPKFDFIIWDEAHHMAASSWAKVKSFFPEAFHVGMSATPERLDGKGLRPYFDAMVTGPSVAELMHEGWLCSYRAFAPTKPDMGGVHSRMGDFIKSEADAAMQKSVITGDIVSHYGKIGRGKKFIARCINIERSKELAAQFRASGIMAWHVDGDTDRGERRQAMTAFRGSHLQGLTNVNLFGEGVDVADATVLVDADPSKSLSKVAQGWGRVFRPVYAPGYDIETRRGRIDAIANSSKPFAIIQDHAGNMFHADGSRNHGLPDDDREWSLDGRQARKRASDDAAPPVRQCPRCYACHRPTPVCPSCGWNYELKARSVEQVDGDLAEIDLAAQRAEARREQGRADTIDALIELGRKRGYKSPEKWAAHLWTARLAKRA